MELVSKVKNPYAPYGREILYMSGNKDADHVSVQAKPYINQFNAFIMQEGFPCIGAQTAYNANTITFGLFDKMDSYRTPMELAYGLQRYLSQMAEKPSLFLTYVALFKYDDFPNERSFEIALWDLLSKLNHVDEKNYDWCSKVDNDPENFNFSYSFGGRAFYLVGMHSESSRKARRFRYPAIAFNLHSQFEDLRNKGRYQRIKEVIRTNELEFSGSVNPMLADFGKGLEAPQYSGRKVGHHWQCPFNTKKNK